MTRNRNPAFLSLPLRSIDKLARQAKPRQIAVMQGAASTEGRAA
ncbi:hypothetical protein [Gellertiella hungarica]|uniref:Uncharacterized protein n=1 Tax=Gellertiella hungarica TaxID=1572859 RepID=A0A7W6J3C4_9HYPH|nr:hypothetical protein [Gellertiella hungarica]MBB4064004.1 hypothetical protein [Gellertiella hungarica]